MQLLSRHRFEGNLNSGGEEHRLDKVSHQSNQDYKSRVPKVRQWRCWKDKKGDANGGLNEWVVAGLRRVFEKPSLAAGLMVVAVVLALIKARAEDKG